MVNAKQRRTLKSKAQVSDITSRLKNLGERQREVENISRDKSEPPAAPSPVPRTIDHMPGSAFDFALPDGCAYHAVGLALHDRLEFEQWETIIRKLMAVQNSSPWWIGDALVYGSKFGNKYKAWLKGATHTYGTLRNYKMVADKFPVSVRNDKLSFTHHAAVASLKMEDAQRLMTECAQKELSKAEFLKVVRNFKNPPKKQEQEQEEEQGRRDDIGLWWTRLLRGQNTVKELSDVIETYKDDGSILTALNDLITTLQTLKQKIEDDKAFKDKEAKRKKAA
jgi:hypothetical protein